MTDVESMLARLRGESELAARGTFSLDREQARTKMRQFQLADPHRWILLLVRAAVLGAATRIRVTVDHESVSTEFDGRPLGRDDFEELYASMFASSAAPAIQARRELALACNAAMALEPEVLRIESGAGSAAVAFEMRPDAPDVISECPKATGGTRVRLVLGGSSSAMASLLAPGRRGPEQRLLVVACRWSDTVIELDGERISFGLDSAKLRGQPTIGSGVLRRCGFDDAGEPAKVVVLQDGLVLTTRKPPALPRGFLAIVDGTHLRTDVSRTEPVEDEAWAALLDAVRVAGTESLLLLLRETLASEATPDDGELPSWTWELFRERLASDGAFELERASELVRTLAELPLWQRADGSRCSTRALAVARTARYTRLELPAQVPSELFDVIVVDETELRRLRVLLPFAVDASAEVSAAIERALRRSRPPAVPLAAEPVPVASPRAPRPPRRTAKPRASDSIGAHHARFLARPQVWKVQHPPLAFGPIVVEHDGVRCTLGVLASASRIAPSPPVARVCVMHQRRVLTEMRLPCPLPGIDAVVTADDFRANPTWNGLADDASRRRVTSVLGVALRALVDAIATADERHSEHARRVLVAAMCASLFDASLLRAWLVLREGSSRPCEELAALVELVERRGLDELRGPLGVALEGGPDTATARLCALVDAHAGDGPRPSLRAALAHELARLFELPLLGSPPQSLAWIACTPSPVVALRTRELDFVRRVLGIEVVAIAPAAVTSGTERSPDEEAPLADVPAATSTDEEAPADDELDDLDEMDELDGAPDESLPAPPGDVAETPSTLAAVAVIEAPAPDPVSTRLAPMPPPRAPESPEGALERAVLDELAAVIASDPGLVLDPLLTRIAMRPLDSNAVALVIDGTIVMNRYHPVVAAAVARAEPDPVLVAFITSAVYTTANVELEDITDDHEAIFIARHAARVRARLP